ncbi:MAG: nicotinate-nucleotide--dimethylbenzimidazole phosphoribosyltransferase [Pyramidobacter sp.]|nr:nicotinate-nucleotide--dimethylbenzimidazole phosphoribosyltransferase [Pyramidobacter sp.]
MNTLDFAELNRRIAPPDASALHASQTHWDSVAKPLGSLGEFEKLITKIAALTGSARVELDRRAVLVLCADNGVIVQGVSQSDCSVTSLVAVNLTKRCSAVCQMARRAGAEIIPVDMGMKNAVDAPGLILRRVAAGTEDFTQGRAMTREQARAAVMTGIELVRECRERGFQILATGEMGIGNTTTSSAMASVFLNCDPQKLTGRGAGLSDEGLRRKIDAIRRGIRVNAPNPNDALDVLSCVGGFDIAGMAGIFIGGALYRVPVVIDGLISAVAALTASLLCPACVCCMIPSHSSSEPAELKIFEKMCLKPLIFADMHLGEGTGAVCMFPLLDMALAVYNGLAFDDIGLAPYQRLS